MCEHIYIYQAPQRKNHVNLAQIRCLPKKNQPCVYKALADFSSSLVWTQQFSPSTPNEENELYLKSVEEVHPSYVPT